MVARLAALALALLYLATAMRLELEPSSVLHYALATFVAACLIWFPEQLGATTGMHTAHGMKTVDAETPGCVVAAFGWLLLLGVPLVYWGMQPMAR